MTRPLFATLEYPLIAPGTGHASQPLQVRCLALVGLTLCMVSFWALQHAYPGMVNDGLLYALAAMARLHPESLGHDIFLNSGSQDHYTIFSPIVATTMRLVGVAPAAAIITFIAQVAFFASAGLLAHKLMPPRLAMLALLLLVTLPAAYGSKHIFLYSEAILTPRVPSEALVLTALACALSRRYLLCAVAITGAMLLHPLMALAGIVVMFYLYVGEQRPSLTLVLVVAGVAALLFISSLDIREGPLGRVDAKWFDLLHWRLQYAFPSLWLQGDWGHTCVPLATLLVGALTALQRSIRSICRAALFVGILGLTVALLGSDLLRVSIVAQAQTWRWLWLATVLSILLLPVIAADAWPRGTASRSACLLIAAAWICIDERFVIVIALAAPAVAAVTSAMNERSARLLQIGAYAVLGLAVLVFLGSWFGELHKTSGATPGDFYSAWDSLRATLHLGTAHGREFLLAGLACLLWWVANFRRDLGSQIVVLGCGLVLCLAVAPLAWSKWTDLAPSQKFVDQFSSWRSQIPPRAQVLAPGIPYIPWIILERPSYWSLRQMAGVVYSKTTALELLRREAIALDLPKTPDPHKDLLAQCAADPLISYIVSTENVGPTPFVPITLDMEGPPLILRLYRCAAASG